MSRLIKGKYIKKNRMYKKITQADTAEYVCDYTDLTKIEGGMIDPGWERFQLISESIIDISETIYYPHIFTNNISAFEYRQNIKSALQREEAEAAKSGLEKLTPLLTLEHPLNKQFLLSTQTHISELEGASSNELLPKYTEALLLTRTNYNEEAITNYTLRYEECFLLDRIAVHLGKCGETARALNIFNSLITSLETSPTDSSFVIENVLPILYHMAQLLSQTENYTEVLKVHTKFQELSVSTKRIALLPRMIYLEAYALLKLGQPEQCEKLLEMIFWVHKLFDEHELAIEVRKNAKEIFGIETGEGTQWTTTLEM